MADGLRSQWLLKPTAPNRHEGVAQFVQLLEPPGMLWISQQVNKASAKHPSTLPPDVSPRHITRFSKAAV
jgi:hypothetical protein